MKKLITVILIMFYSVASYAQNDDIGILAGSSYYTGDLNPGKPFLDCMPIVGAFYRHNFNERLALRGGFNITSLQGGDFQNRGLSFKSNLKELSLQLEVNFNEFGIDMSDKRFSPYIFGGIGYTWFTTKKDSARLIQTSLTTDIKSFPFGIGIKYNPFENVTIGAEWGLRKTMGGDADKIDLVYEPGVRVSNAKDWYGFAAISVAVRLNFFQAQRCEELTRH